MAASKKNGKKTQDADLEKRARYPIGLLFQISTLSACVAYLIFSISGRMDFTTAMYRALVVFVGVTFCLGVVMVTIVSVLHRVKMHEAEERIRQMYEEQLAEQQVIESQHRMAQSSQESHSA